MRYDYSLDVGQSMESEEKLKEEQEKQQAQENAPATGEELSAKRIEEEIKQEAEKEAQESQETPEEEPEENKEEASDSEANEKIDSEKEEDLTVKEISFEKAQLIEEHQKAQKTIEDWEKSSEEDEDSEEKPKDELEEDVNEIIEDSFKEPEGYINNNNSSNVQEYVPEPRSYAVPIALILIFIGAVIFGFVYFMYPGETTTAATVSTPGEEIALEPVQETVPETPVVAENITAPSKNFSKTKAAANESATKKPAAVQKSDKEMLNDILLSGLN